MEFIYTEVSHKCSKVVTKRYSTSFSIGIKLLSNKFRLPVYSVYGFVRLADEIVDSFHSHNREELLKEFKGDTYLAIKRKISTNPILHGFQQTVHNFNISTDLIEAFFKSMEMDLKRNSYEKDEYYEYIFGSAEVVGLMCLQVFCERDLQKYEELQYPARKLGAAFQKVNFLRDLKSDYNYLGRIYFPGVDFNNFSPAQKKNIEKEIENDFKEAFEGIKRLPDGAKLGVYVAYIYYYQLLRKIRRSPAENVISGRIRIPDNQKIALLIKSYLKYSFGIL